MPVATRHEYNVLGDGDQLPRTLARNPAAVERGNADLRRRRAGATVDDGAYSRRPKLEALLKSKIAFAE